MKKAKAVFLDAHTLDPGDNDLSVLEEIVNLERYPRTESNQVIERAREAEILIINKCPVTSDTIQELNNLKLIQVAATGYNNVDVAFAANQGIPVCNISGYSTSSVAQHVFAMLLAYFNKTSVYTGEVSKGAWAECRDFSYWHEPIRELSGKRLGILGYGDIGKAVCRIALAFGMDVIVSHTRKMDDSRGLRFVDLEEMLSQSDVISLHAPLTDATRHIINSRHIGLMKENLVLVNTARGGLINNTDLKEALDNRRIEAALLDVLDQEPPSADHPLTQTKHCYISPHQAWASLESRQRLLGMLYQNINAFLSGSLLNKVN